MAGIFPSKQLKMSTPMAEVFNFEDFSDEIILKVLSYLDLNNRFNCYLTSKRLRAICQDHTLPPMWQKVHLFGPNLLFDASEESLFCELTGDLLDVNRENYIQSTTWKHAIIHLTYPCENSQYFCGEMNHILKQRTKNYLNLNIENLNDRSIEEILGKGCKYLLMSDILPRVGCQIISKICREKEFLELKEVAFTWCIPGEQFLNNGHQHPGISLLKEDPLKDGCEASSFDCNCQKHSLHL